MKSILTVAALVAGLAVPAMAEEATTAPAPVPQATQPAVEQVVPAALPQQSQASDALPMSVPEGQADAATRKSGGGCAHEKTVYLTN